MSAPSEERGTHPGSELASSSPTSPSSQAIPSSRVAPARRLSLAWILPVLALVFVAYTSWRAWVERGPLITVQVEDGHGIQAGDPLRYRGVQVGRIEDQSLAADLSSVLLEVRLDPAAAPIAREGSRFWLVRPVLSLEGVQGLETIIGANYLAVLPGPAGGPARSEFVATEEPPIAEWIDPQGLFLTLEAPTRFGLAPGAPITFRDFQVGTVVAVGLESDATAVELQIYVRPEYARLVREDTRFWETGGVEIDLAITQGLRVDIGTLRSLLVGGIAMATPTEPGPGVESGHRFYLNAEPEDEWLEWRPTLPVGAAEVPSEQALPRMQRARLSWSQGRVFGRRRAREGWLLPIPGGLLGPADVLTPIAGARGEGALLEVGGQSQPLREPPAESAGGLALQALGPRFARPWPAQRVRDDGPAGDCLVVGDPSVPPLAISAARLARAGEGWRIEGGQGFDATWHGAAVVEREASELVGILVLDESGARVVQPPREWWNSRARR